MGMGPFMAGGCKMNIDYKCLKCQKITRSKWRENPQKGTYIIARCGCGNHGTSDWKYNIVGFEKQEKSDG